MVASIVHGVDEGGLSLFDLLDGAPERGFEIVGVFKRVFGESAHRSRETDKVWVGIVEIHAEKNDAQTVNLQSPELC